MTKTKRADQVQSGETIETSGAWEPVSDIHRTRDQIALFFCNWRDVYRPDELVRVKA
jgi:hypothetical protein